MAYPEMMRRKKTITVDATCIRDNGSSTARRQEAEAVGRNVRRRSTRGTTDNSRRKFASGPRRRRKLENVLLLTRRLEFRTSDAIPSTFRVIKVYFLINNVDLRT